MTPQNASQSQRPAIESLSRRELLAYTAAFGSAFVAAQGLAADTPSAGAQAKAGPSTSAPRKKYDMKKSINLWALPYPQKMTLKECFQLCKDAGFDGVEVNFALEGDISPQAGESDLKAIGKCAEKTGLAISGMCSFLFWPYSLTHEDPKRRERGLELAIQMIRTARLSAPRTSWWCPEPSTSRGSKTIRPCRSRSATAGPRKQCGS